MINARKKRNNFISHSFYCIGTRVYRVVPLINSNIHWCDNNNDFFFFSFCWLHLLLYDDIYTFAGRLLLLKSMSFRRYIHFFLSYINSFEYVFIEYFSTMNWRYMYVAISINTHTTLVYTPFTVGERIFRFIVPQDLLLICYLFDAFI